MFDQANTLELNLFWLSKAAHNFYHPPILSRSLPKAQRGLNGGEDKLQLLHSDNADYTQSTPNLDFCVTAEFCAAKNLRSQVEIGAPSSPPEPFH